MKTMTDGEWQAKVVEWGRAMLAHWDLVSELRAWERRSGIRHD